MALSAIQAYLIKNTYTLEKDALIQETNEAVREIRDSPEIDSLNMVWRQALADELIDYRLDDFSIVSFMERITAKADSLSPIYHNYYQEKLQDVDLGYNIKFKKNLTEIIIFEGSKTDTVFGAGERKKLRILGEDFEEEKAITTQTSIWQSQSTGSPDTVVATNSGFQMATEDLVLIEDRITIIFGRLAGLFIISILIFLFVVGLLFYSIKNLIIQKKIAEIKTDFVNNITHEFKTPLATLAIATKSLNKKEIIHSPDALESTLKIMERQNIRLQELLDQVMNYSLSSKEIVLHKEPVSSKNYFINLIEDFRISMSHKNFIINTEVQPIEVTLELDRFHFTTALQNILENALKYSDETAQILLKTEVKNSTYIINITDNGTGIPKRDQTEIFNKFYRINSGNLHNVKGMGLGLYYASQIIKAHKGTIAVQSELKKGSCFTIEIPLA